jgi:hypothetical protein
MLRRKEEFFSLGRDILGEDCFGADFLCAVVCVCVGYGQIYVLRQGERRWYVRRWKTTPTGGKGVGTGGSQLSNSNLGRNQLSRVFSSFGEVPLLLGSISRGWA